MAEMDRLRALEEKASKIDVLFNHPRIGPRFEKFLEEVEEDLK